MSQLRSIQFTASRDIDSADSELRPYRPQHGNDLWGIPINTDRNLLDNIRKAQKRNLSAPCTIALMSTHNKYNELNDKQSFHKRVSFSKSAGTSSDGRKHKKADNNKENTITMMTTTTIMNSPRHFTGSSRMNAAIVTWFDGPRVNCGVPHSNVSKYFTPMPRS